ncbi:MAG TPA: adenylate/guanylate cyclase domain-containing protein [Candidatus Binatia bacterium]|nr:adenylate/guanylate cyclase domain-containing protein [Candidatus Binatia bacterium]
MARFQRKRLDQPDEIRDYPKGRTEIFELDDFVIGRMVMEPGWHWRDDVQPIAKTERCMNHHLGYCVSGRLRVSYEDGTEGVINREEMFEMPPGHDAWSEGDEPWIAIDFRGVRSYARKPAAVGDRILPTVLFTDIVGSTATLERVGDAAWRELLAEHNERIGLELDRYRGREVSKTGDGVLAIFDGAARAVECAAAIVNRLREIGIEIRAGLHTGEVELVAGGVRGVAVHTASRVMALAGAGEILVSSTTHELAAGSGLSFTSRGRHALKGLVGDREVYALAPTPVRG